MQYEIRSKLALHLFNPPSGLDSIVLFGFLCNSERAVDVNIENMRSSEWS